MLPQKRSLRIIIGLQLGLLLMLLSFQTIHHWSHHHGQATTTSAEQACDLCKIKAVPYVSGDVYSFEASASFPRVSAEAHYYCFYQSALPGMEDGRGPPLMA